MGRKVFVVGVGMTKFEKPGSRPGWDYPQMAEEAGTKALADAGIPYGEIDQACVGYVYGESTCGQRAVYGLGLTGIPVYNVNNNCSTGSTALFMAKQFIEGGIADCVLALGFEKMAKGSLGATFMDRTIPMDKHMMAMIELRGFERARPRRRSSATPAASTWSATARRPSTSPRSPQEPPALDAQPVLAVPGRVLARADPGGADGARRRSPSSSAARPPTAAAAAVLCSEDVVKRHGLEAQAVEIVGMAMTTDFPSTFDESSPSSSSAPT